MRRDATIIGGCFGVISTAIRSLAEDIPPLPSTTPERPIAPRLSGLEAIEVVS